jgi:hypothetical protein
MSQLLFEEKRLPHIGFPDHIWRCWHSTQELGINAHSFDIKTISSNEIQVLNLSKHLIYAIVWVSRDYEYGIILVCRQITNIL